MSIEQIEREICKFYSEREDRPVQDEWFKNLHDKLSVEVTKARKQNKINYDRIGTLRGFLGNLLHDFPLVYEATFPHKADRESRVIANLVDAALCKQGMSDQKSRNEFLASMLTLLKYKAAFKDPHLSGKTKTLLKALLANPFLKNDAQVEQKNTMCDRVRTLTAPVVGLGVGAIAYYNLGIFGGTICGTGAAAVMNYMAPAPSKKRRR